MIPKEVNSSNDPLVSIIVPVYNVEKYLRKCLDSIISQTLSNIEIICVNDGTKDNSVAILNEYAASDNRIKIIHKKNGGLSSARNEGIKHAKAEFIGFVDSDDWIEPDTYELAYKKMVEHSADFVCWYARIETEDNTFINDEITKAQEYHKIVNAGLFDVTDDIFIYCTVTAWNKLYKKSIIQGNNLTFPVGLLNEDVEFFFKYALICRRVYFINKYLTHYLQRSGSIIWMSSKKKKLTINRIKIMRRLYHYFCANGIISRFGKTLSKAFIWDCIASECWVNSGKNQLFIYWYAGNIVKKMDLGLLEDSNNILYNLKHRKYSELFYFFNNITLRDVIFRKLGKNIVYRILRKLYHKTSYYKIKTLQSKYDEVSQKLNETSDKQREMQNGQIEFEEKTSREFKDITCNIEESKQNLDEINRKIMEAEAKQADFSQELGDIHQKLGDTSRELDEAKHFWSEINDKSIENSKTLEVVSGRVEQLNHWLNETNNWLKNTDDKSVETSRGLEAINQRVEQLNHWLNETNSWLKQTSDTTNNFEKTKKRLQQESILLNRLVKDQIDDALDKLNQEKNGFIYFNGLDDKILKSTEMISGSFDNKKIIDELKNLGEFLFCPNNGNLGDVIIAEAEYQLFMTMGLEYKILDVWKKDNREMDLCLQYKNYVYGGGGLFIELYDYQNLIKVFTLKHFKKIVILPSSFYKCDDLLRIFDERFIVFCREEQSYRYCVSLNKKAKFILADDMAFYLDSKLIIKDRLLYSIPTDRPKEYYLPLYESWSYFMITNNNMKEAVNNKVLFLKDGQKLGLLLRTDEESIIREEEKNKYSANILDLSSFGWISCTDPGLVKVLSLSFILALNYFDVIVTDRLHIGIVSARLGKKVYLLDNNYGKISGVYKQSLVYFSNVKFVDDISKIDGVSFAGIHEEKDGDFNFEMTFAEFLAVYFSVCNLDGVVRKTFLNEVNDGQD